MLNAPQSPRAHQELGKGWFVAVDGPNGAGKSTVVGAVVARLRSLGVAVEETREPTSSSIGALIRELEGRADPLAFAMLIAADRVDHCRRVIVPALDMDRTVVCDRFVASSLALQFLDGVPIDRIRALNQWAVRPSLTVILTAPPAVLEGRLANRGHVTAFERRFSRVQEVEAYRQAARMLNDDGDGVLELDTSTLSTEECVSRIASVRERMWRPRAPS